MDLLDPLFRAVPVPLWVPVGLTFLGMAFGLVGGVLLAWGYGTNGGE
jgi:hypothetical protein